ncbi:SubName: Full=Uncharacterized protein {ECO:0000313/EMBL:CCA74518.1} [Serendipita indica DSM 11827]|nr:SubName: Full=Uncharacterized protein {ECO:0000313/EMBL:CCA74518.1} [Serendipita indica DSM 11827]
MPHILLRALRHRSTPTLLPSSHRQHAAAPVARPPPLIPSIVVTIPEEEGGSHYCALLGSPYPATDSGIIAATNAAATMLHSNRMYAPYEATSPNEEELPLETVDDFGASYSSSGFDAPLPDFEALEETISQLRNAEHAPVFRRPSSRCEEDGIVMPRRKSAHADADVPQYVHEAGAGRGFLPSGAKKTSRPRPPRRVQSSPVPHDVEQFTDAQNDSLFFSSELAARERVSSPPPKPSLFRRFSKKQRPAPLSSISSDSFVAPRNVVSPPLTSPTDPFAFDQTLPTSPTQEGWNSDGEPKRRKRSSLKRLLLLEKRERASVVYDTMQSIHEVSTQATVESPDNGYTMPNCFNDIDERETQESDRDKPLPPLPLPPSQSAGSSDEYVEVQICNSPVLFDVVTAIRDIPPEPAYEEVQEPVVSATPKAKEAPLKSIKRKLSLKRLKERFSSTPTPAPPVPPMPVQFRPVTRPPIPSVVITAPMDWPMSHVETFMDESTVSPRVTSETLVSAPIPDEDSNLSTSSEDSSGSSAIDSSALPSPDSTPPATPDHIVSVGSVFESQQESIKDGHTKQVNVDVQIVTPLSHVEIDAGIPRSPGRIDLGSLDARVAIVTA